MFKEFKEFALRGNVLDLAVAVIIGGAFGKIVSSMVNDIIMPPIGRLMGKMDFSQLVIPLARPQGMEFTKITLKSATEANIAVIKLGLFINNVIDFAIVALVIFLVIRLVNKLKKQPVPAPAQPTTKECPFCFSAIALKAVRCPNCTSEIKLPA
ncbi:MAG: large conductance mechanosensitive channel protein MscL [Candidatus Edwardsbacteria bacterium]|nr:large conductance mechanosensitive channel protein MscL [Candidatus Edwardsbacteria bacterium]